MFAKPLFLLSLMMASVALLDAASSCAPSCLGASEGDKVRVPWDCTLYAVCGDLHGDGVLWPSDETSCPAGQYFNSNVTPGECAPIDGADAGFCANDCSPCKLYWSSLGDTTPDPTDCGTYHTCVANGQFVVFHCSIEYPDRPYYDYVNGGCSSDQRVCYHFCDACHPYCLQGETYIADPLDCTGFYYCSPPELTHFTCPVEETFDPNLKICSMEASCVTC